MPIRDEVEAFAFLAQRESHHRGIRYANTQWAADRGLRLLAEGKDDQTPRTAIAIKAEVCPIDPLATAFIKFWVSDLAVPPDELAVYLAKVLVRAIDWCAANGHDRLWGFVPLNAPHLLTLLDAPAGRGLIERTHFAPLTALEQQDPELVDYSPGVFYITDSSRFTACKTFLEGSPRR